MSHGNASYLRFSLEESVWFQKGQEVEELISISLDPNITINESEQYVTIKGSLELHGEYRHDEYDDSEDDESLANPKFVQTVEMREEGVCFFTHHFPVEITIPKSRIHDIDSIDVAVETFDYAFPERSCLRLSADLMITGLYGEQQHEFFQDSEDEFIEEPDDDWEIRTEETEELEHEHEEETEEYTEIPLEAFGSDREAEDEEITAESDEQEEDIYEPFTAEARKEADAEETLQSLLNDEEREETPEEEEEPAPEYTATVETREEETEAEEAEAEAEEPILENEESSIPDIFFIANRKQAEDIDVTEEESEESVSAAKESRAEDESEEAEAEYVHDDEDTEETEEEAKAENKKKKWKKKQNLSIAEFLARKEETTESHAKLRVCIVQKGDTIDTLSDRYDVSVNHLQRVNNLDINQDVYEGQVLYIPIVQKQK